MSIVTGLSAAKTGFDLIKGIVEHLKREDVNVQEVQARLIELQDLMLQARSGLFDALEENRKLQDRVDELARAGEIGKEFVFGEGLYWREGYPYCPSCWDADRRTIRLGGPVPTSSGEVWQCPDHKVHYVVHTRH